MQNRKLLALLVLLAAMPTRAQIAGAPNAHPAPVGADEGSKILDRTAREVSGSLEVFSNVRCTERVQLTKLNASNHVEYSESAVYDYFVLLEGTQDDLLLNESRLEQHEQEKRHTKLKQTAARTSDARNVPMLISNGFSTLFLIFHPYYRDSFRFEPEPAETVDGETRLRVHFTHIPGTRSPAALAVRGREYPLELTGTAWIDPADAGITRIELTLANDMRDVGLRSLHAQVDFAPVKLPGWTETYRFPDTATIDVESLRQHWCNVHTFSNYQRFLVETQQSVDKPKPQ